MRNGRNPNTSAKTTGYTPIVISAITHLPNMMGYHKERLEVIRCSLETMRKNAGMDCQIAIWDNGSCIELRNWLQNEYKPDYLIMSRNVGKSIARASIVRMLPSGTIVGVADDDMYYYLGWLREQVHVLRLFPNVGTVSGWPVRTQFRFHNRSTIAWGKKNAKFEVGRFIPPNEDRDFCTSIGRDYKLHAAKYNRKTGLGSADDNDVVLTYKDCKVYATGHHAQWIGFVDTIAPFLEYTEEAMADERPFEKAIDDAGLLRLTTYKRYTRHIGNILDDEVRDLWQGKSNQA